MTSFVPKKEARGFIMPNFIVENTQLYLGSKLLYGILTDYARDRDFCYPSKLTLASRLGCSLNSVKTWLRQLVELGFLKIQANLIYLLCPRAYKSVNYPLLNEAPPCEENHTEDSACQILTEGVSNFDTESNVFKANNIPPTPNRPRPVSNRPSLVKTRAGDFSNINKSFEEFWNVYPKQEAKESARSLWHRFWRQGKLPSLETLKESIEFFRESYAWQRENGRYVPQFVNFIRGLRWQDAPKKAVDTGETKPQIKYEIESPQARDARIFLEKQRFEDKSQALDKAFEDFKSFFESPNSIDNFVAFALFSNLYEKSQVPFIDKKQGICLVEFLKSKTHNGVE